MTSTPKSVYLPIDAVKRDQIYGGARTSGLTVFYNTAISQGDVAKDRSLFAVVHPTDPSNTDVGWTVPVGDTFIYGSEGAEVQALAQGARGWWLSADDSPVLQPMVDAARERDWAVEQHAEINRQIESLRQRYARDIEVIGEALLEEAENRDWCNEYDEFVEGVNSRLGMELPEREREFNVEVEATYSLTVPVTARNADEARERAEESDMIDHDEADAYNFRSASAVEASEA